MAPRWTETRSQCPRAALDASCRVAACCATIVCMAVFNPFLPSFQNNPYPQYAALRAAEPVHFSPALQAWVLTAYEDCALVLRDDETFSSSSDSASGQLAQVLQRQRREFPAGRDADRAQLRPARAHPPPHPAQPRLHTARHRGPAPAHQGDRRFAAGRRGRLGRPLRCRERLRATPPDHRNRGAAGSPAGGSRPLQTLVGGRSRAQRTCSTRPPSSTPRERRPRS